MVLFQHHPCGFLIFFSMVNGQNKWQEVTKDTSDSFCSHTSEQLHRTKAISSYALGSAAIVSWPQIIMVLETE